VRLRVAPRLPRNRPVLGGQSRIGERAVGKPRPFTARCGALGHTQEAHHEGFRHPAHGQTRRARARRDGALTRYGVNVKAVASLAVGTGVLVRIIADREEPARAALQAAQIPFEEHEVVTVLLENRAGELAAVSQKLADARVNLRAIYLTGIVDNLVELAIAVDDVDKAAEVLE
jgi:hypothetical protein